MAVNSPAGQLLRRALDLKALIKLGLHLSPGAIATDEIYAMLVVEDELNRLDKQNSKDRQ